ncbi:MAG: hypothetical protein M3295_06435 [Chloroflexota bacterium]|nr:hypothetical protein [Chloroflexota bacterium]
MAGPKPGQIRCPTCHRSTPALEFCQRCGSPIPPGARMRPRGMDREELQARIRARRSGVPYRRGAVPADYEPQPLPARAPAEPWTDEAWADYQDRAADEGVSDTGPAAWSPPEEPRWEQPVVAPPRRPPGYVDDPTIRGPAYGTAADAEYGEHPSWEPLPYDQTAPSDTRYRLREDWEERRRSSSSNPFLVIGFIGLGALALLGGAMIAGIFGRGSDNEGVAVNPTASAAAPVISTVAATPVVTPSVAPAGSDEPGATATPEFAFPDGFRAAAQPCLSEPRAPSCPDGAQVVSTSNGSVWILVTFEDIQGGDLIGARGVGPDGQPIGDASWEAPGPGNGWAYFAFSLGGLSEGKYEVTVTRNSQPAAVTEFRIEN